MKCSCGGGGGEQVGQEGESLIFIQQKKEKVQLLKKVLSGRHATT